MLLNLMYVSFKENNSVRAADETVTPNPKKSKHNKRKKQKEQPSNVGIQGSLDNQTDSTDVNTEYF